MASLEEFWISSRYYASRLRCKCGVECSGEDALIEHCFETQHILKTGLSGFAGLIPNRGGFIPALQPDFFEQMSKRSEHEKERVLKDAKGVAAGPAYEQAALVVSPRGASSPLEVCKGSPPNQTWGRRLYRT